VTNDTSSEPLEGPCVFCGKRSDYRAHPVNNLRRGTPNPDGTIPLIDKPPVWLCVECLRRYQQNEVALGWCERCISWGSAFARSECGRVYEPA
jgi:hypothetical protein